jgi:hypothetical protein
MQQPTIKKEMRRAWVVVVVMVEAHSLTKQAQACTPRHNVHEETLQQESKITLLVKTSLRYCSDLLVSDKIKNISASARRRRKSGVCIRYSTQLTRERERRKKKKKGDVSCCCCCYVMLFTACSACTEGGWLIWPKVCFHEL